VNRARRVRAAPAVVLLVLIGGGCTVASPSPAAYRERTALVITDAISHVATAQKVLEASQDDKILGAYALATVRSSDDTLNTAVGAYEELYPPRSMDPTFNRASSLLGDATDLVTAARIALYRHDRADYPGLVDDLEQLTAELERLEKELS
jgi:hypothetical protein